MKSISAPSAPVGAATATEPGMACSSGADGCTTCSDEALEVSVVELLGRGFALVGAGGPGGPGGDAVAEGPLALEEVSVALVDAAVGDVILVHAKEAIAVVTRRGMPVVAATEAVGSPIETAELAQRRAPQGRLPSQCA